MTLIRQCVMLFSLISVPVMSYAAPPALTGFMPAGGQRGTVVEVTALGTFDSWPVQSWTGDKKLNVQVTKEKGKLRIVIDQDAIPGIYWLRLFNEEGASSLRPFIVGTLKEINEVEPNDQLNQAQAFSVPTVINGKLNRNGDIDCLAVTLQKGQVLTASIESHQTLRSAGDLVMQMVSPAGVVLDQNHDYRGLDPQITYQSPVDQKVIVRLFAFPAIPDQSIRLSGGDLYVYRLTATTHGVSEYALPLALQRDKPAQPRLIGHHLLRKNALLHLHGDDATVYHPDEALTASVRLESFPTWDATVDKPEVPFSLPASITGQLREKEPVFTCSFQAFKGKKAMIQVLSQGLGLDVDPVLRILDTKGQVIHQADVKDLNSDLKTTFTPAADGLYSLKVKDLHDRTGMRQVFLLRLLPEMPDYSLAVDNDRFIVSTSKPLEIPLKITREAGMSEEVEIAVKGLPAEITHKIITTGSGTKKTVSLRLDAGKPGINTTFQIIATARGTSPRFAQTTLPVYNITVDTFWLTTVR